MLWLRCSLAGDSRRINQEDNMTYLRDLWHDIRMAWSAFRYVRTHLRRGGNPDEAF
jgi:hypothetical protein